MRVNLIVPEFTQHPLVKAAGAQWDFNASKCWYVTNPITFERCRRWLPDPNATCPQMPVQRQWVWSSRENAAAARRRGWVFDPVHLCWYVPEATVAVCEIDTSLLQLDA
eukprot:5534-Heterococcus_DN1.PRE.2